MLQAPYILFGIDCAPGTQNGAAIIQAVEAGFPIKTGITSLGVENVFVVEVTPGSAAQAWRTVSQYLDAQDRNLGGTLRWFAQLCRTIEIAGN